MARPVKETPILFGADARNFERIMKENKNKHISKKERDDINIALKSFNFVPSTKKELWIL